MLTSENEPRLSGGTTPFKALSRTCGTSFWPSLPHPWALSCNYNPSMMRTLHLSRATGPIPLPYAIIFISKFQAPRQPRRYIYTRY